MLRPRGTRACSQEPQGAIPPRALLPRALAGYEAEPSLWLLGVAPAHLTKPTFDEEKVAQAAVVIGGPLKRYRDSEGVVSSPVRTLHADASREARVSTLQNRIVTRIHLGEFRRLVPARLPCGA